MLCVGVCDFVDFFVLVDEVLWIMCVLFDNVGELVNCYGKVIVLFGVCVGMGVSMFVVNLLVLM